MDENGLICAYLMDQEGGAEKLDWEAVEQWKPGQGPLWLHFDYTNSEAAHWISSKSGLDEVLASALLTEETRPRASLIGGGVLISLRGVNLSPGSEPED